MTARALLWWSAAVLLLAATTLAVVGLTQPVIDLPVDGSAADASTTNAPTAPVLIGAGLAALACVLAALRRVTPTRVTAALATGILTGITMTSALSVDDLSALEDTTDADPAQAFTAGPGLTVLIIATAAAVLATLLTWLPISTSGPPTDGEPES
ncbi:hypothetical protein [Actinokineospora inagensis]|uniref:hypothetical protein n=1 Tax=Actinokineospora inagensis TaxID=103730 RepID=UPI0003F6E2EC|nr:hypothetical protein [Actinokineospora inagensis]